MKILATIQDKANAQALVKILALVAIKIKGGKIVELKKEIANSLYPHALQFIKDFNSKDATIFEELWSNILQKSTVVEPIVAKLLPVLRAMIRNNDLKGKLDIISTDSKEMLNTLLAFFANPSSLNKFDAVVRKSNLLKEPKITAKLVSVFKELSDRQYLNPMPSSGPMTDSPTSSDPASSPTHGSKVLENILLNITNIGYQLTGRKNVTKLEKEEKDKLNADPDKKALIRQFNQLRTELTNVKKNEIRNIVVESGKPYITVKEMSQALKKAKLPVSIPSGIQNSTIVYINANGEYCDKDGRVCIKQYANEPNAIWSDNPSYSHDGGRGKSWLLKVQTGDTVNYYQTKDKIAQKRSTRFDNIDKLLNSGIEKAKAAWRADMSGGLDDENTVYSNIAEYMFWTASRVGSGEGSTAGSRTYGASNFLVSHIKNLPKSGTPSSLTIEYPVKSGASITFVLSSDPGNLPNKSDARYVNMLIKFIINKTKGKKPNEAVFTINNNRVDTGKLNMYLKSKLGADFTNKSFRTLRGSELAIVALEAVTEEFNKQQDAIKPKKLPQKTVDHLFDVAMKAVGELLGHVRRVGDDGEPVTTSSTAIKSYIQPSIMVNWYKERGYQPQARVISAARAASVEV